MRDMNSNFLFFSSTHYCLDPNKGLSRKNFHNDNQYVESEFQVHDKFDGAGWIANPTCKNEFTPAACTNKWQFQDDRNRRVVDEDIKVKCEGNV